MASNSYTFINPYTFVPFPKEGAVRTDLTDLAKQEEPTSSGEIKCTLITKNQIAIPDTLKNINALEDEVKEYDFFGMDIDGKRTAVIPGSGIRGVIRSVYETLTDSCVHLNDKEDDYFHTRVNKTTPGIIEFHNGKYILYKAERFRDKVSDLKNNLHSTGEDVKFYPKRCNTPAPGLVKDFFPSKAIKDVPENGVYLKVNSFGSGNRASHPSVFVKGKIIESNFDPKYIERLKINVKMYEGIYKEEYKKAIENMENNGKQLPVWYWQDSETKHYYLAPSQYSRAVFVKQPKDLVERAGVKSCSSKKKACAACALFGFIGGDDSKASHVRFMDAVCKTDDCFDGRYILPVLSTPRLSSFEFYLDSSGSKDRDKFGPDSPGVTLAGRKFYWHDPKRRITKDDESAKKNPKMAAKVELVKPGSKFEFSVFFDRITDTQLKQLIFALNLGENNEDSSLCHKIGHGKPIGLGSAKIVVDSVSKRSYKQGIYSVENITEDILPEVKRDLFRQSPELKDFLGKVLNFKFVGGKVVDYPRQQPEGDIFKWFAGNRGSLRSKGYIEVKQHLPKITDKDQTLQGESPDNGRNNGYNNRNSSTNSGYKRRW